MALFVNSFTFSGFIGRDPVKRTLPSGSDVVNFSVALCKRKKEDPTLWLDIAVYGKHGDFAQSLRKSDQVVITGALYARNYTDKNGNERQTLEVNATNIAKVYAEANTQAAPTNKPTGAVATAQRLASGYPSDNYVAKEDNDGLPF